MRKDCFEAIALCKKIAKDRDSAPAIKLQAIDRQIKLWGLIATSEGTHKHKDKVELSGPNGQGLLTAQAHAAAASLDAFRQRRAKEQKTIEVQAEEA